MQSSGQTAEIMPVVTLNNGVPVVTSMQVAEHFEKRHKNVLRDIRRIDEETPDSEWTRLNFEQCLKINELANGKAEPYYLITREGFMILGMGFTGTRAMGMKIAFIKAFAAMEQEVLTLRRGQQPGLDELGLTPAAKRLPVRQKVMLMNNATQIARAEDRMSEVKVIYADLCNTVADGSVPWAELVVAKGEESVRLFVAQCGQESDNPRRRVLLSVFYAAYASWCGTSEGDFTPVSQNRFVDLLRKFAPTARLSKPRRDTPKNRPYYIVGLMLQKGLGMF